MRLQRPCVLMILSLFLAFAIACTDTPIPAGKYVASADKGRQLPAITLTLTANGQGSWAGEGDSVPFRWDHKGNEIWLHTKSGGILAGKIAGENIEISLPGTGPLIFSKAKN